MSRFVKKENWPKRVMTLWPFFGFNLLFVSPTYSVELQAKLDTQLRFDDRSGRHERYQYRVRFYPSIILDDDKMWSFNAFAATGDDFSSSQNTLDDGNADLFYLRRAYLRHENDQGKTEIGILPTYKGRVSSTGLSKDGWIAGIRHVANFSHGKFEVVLGELGDTRASRALDVSDDLNYVELEYSGKLSHQTSIEFSFERLLSSNFVTGEVRYQTASEVTFAVELIDKVDTNDFKFVASTEKTFDAYSQEWEVFAYYSYVSDSFGARAKLTEDFLAKGHGVAIEFESSFNLSKSQFAPLNWFAKFETFEGNTRVQLGVKYGLSL
ncbi:MAG: hypothetical protein ACI9LX_002448 [Paraglaciecola sp.]|jgi:hypothetical protein